MGGLSQLTLGDVVRAVNRYRPVLIGLAVVLAVFAFLPDPEWRSASDASGQSLLEQTRARGGAPASSQTAAQLTTDAAPDAVPGVGGTSDAFASSPSSYGDVSGTSAGGTGEETGFGDSSGSSDSSDFNFSDTSFGEAAASSEANKEPLQIVSSAWASRSAGTPLAQEGVPQGTLPVGKRVDNDKLSFVRVRGGQTILRLAEDPAGSRSTNGPVIVQVCQITTSSWTDAEAIGIGDAPPYDTTKCAVGSRGPDGTWTFDLVSFPSPTDDRGLALVPGEGAGLDFQVAFKKA